MIGLDRHRLLFGLVLLVTALFVTSGYPPAARWRRQIRQAAIIAFCLATIAALTDLLCWCLNLCE
jgi:ABC-type Mn2+/Zn2+ transport system permease subunit